MPDGAGVLRAEFVYAEDAQTHPMTMGLSPPPRVRMNVADAAPQFMPTTLVTDVVVSLVGKAAESLIDAAAAHAKAEVTTLDTTVPLDGFYTANGALAVDDGFLVFHNGVRLDADDATMLAVFRLDASPDGSAFRFTVAKWRCERFLEQRGWRILQKQDSRDFAVKIEFLSPGAAGLGARAVFFEQIFSSMEADEIKVAFHAGQKLPWLATPPRPAAASDAQPTALVLPLNLRVTVVESTLPNQFATWLQALAQEKKADVVSLVKDAVREGIDPGFESSQSAKRADAAGTAYAAYKTAWDEGMALAAARPAAPPATAGEAELTRHKAALTEWNAKLTVKKQSLQAKLMAARTAFAAAGLRWEAALPALPA